ncbi:MAG TPA: hypothetical protein VL359_18965, partial [bacterium]|nr:hypothetical protein [bacterium]
MARKEGKLLFFAALGVLTLALAGCGGSSSSGAAPAGGAASSAGAAAARQNGPQRPGSGRFNTAVPVQAAVVQVGQLRTSNDTAGTIVAVTQSSVASQVAGVVSSVVHQAGDWVKAGANVV